MKVAMKKKQVAILVPVYKEKLSELEQISFEQLLRVLGRYPIIFVGPQGLSVDYGEGTENIPFVGFQKAYFTSEASYSRLLLNPDFYRVFEEYEYILIYQLDAFVFHDRLSEFCSLGYDYWGAPVYRAHYNFFWQALGLRVGNGGLSLRKVSSAIRALEETKDWLRNNPFWDVLEGWEDLFWSCLGGREDYDFICPPVNLAIQFSIQDDVCHGFKNFKKNNTFGCHGWNKPVNLGKWQKLIAEAGYEQVNSIAINEALPDWRERLVREYIFHRNGVNVNLLIGMVKSRKFAKANRLVSAWLERYPDGNVEWTGSAEAMLAVVKLCLSYDSGQKNKEVQTLLDCCKLALIRIMSAPVFSMWTGYMIEDIVKFMGRKSDIDVAMLDRLEFVRKGIGSNTFMQNIYYNLHIIEIGLSVGAAVAWFKKLLAEKIVTPEQLKLIAEDSTRNPGKVLGIIRQKTADPRGNDLVANKREKICFIACVNDESQFENYCLAGLKRLIVPENISVEVLAIRGASSMAAGYEEARRASGAKYKLYLHQDLEITNENFIADILAEFRQNPQAGLIGMIGTKFLHPDCNWWDRTGDNLVGGVREIFADREYNNLDLCEFMKESWEPVEAVDGVLMATQYDVPWREDIMDGWHFYDVSQCLEYTRAGYDIMVPRQKPLWTIHHRPMAMREGWLELWDKYRRRVMLEYTDEILPPDRLKEREILLVVCDHGDSEDRLSEKYGYLKGLTVPDGYHLSIEVVKDWCPAWSYGRWQKNSPAKYKIYLDGDARIVNRRCIVELLRIFVSDQNLGAIGVEKGPLGTIDGRFVATQYDMPWDDIRYPGNRYAAEAMCLDMERKGYKVIVAEQEDPWVEMEPGDPEGPEIIRPWAEAHLRSNGIWRVGKSSRDVFMKEYGIL